MNFTSWKQVLLDLLFPTSCVSCGVLGSVFCASCKSVIPLSEPACFVCNARKPSGSICDSCRPRAPYLTRVWWAVAYENEHVRNAITQFKYNSNHSLAQTLADSMIASVKKRAQAHNVHIPAHAVLLAVPLHTQKRKLRGFNQSELLASHIARALSLPLLQTSTLMRTRNTSPQAKAGGREKRMKNVDHAFEVHKASVDKIKNRLIILVDDIATTGSTLNDAARALKIAGAAHVWALVVAKG